MFNWIGNGIRMLDTIMYWKVVGHSIVFFKYWALGALLRDTEHLCWMMEELMCCILHPPFTFSVEKCDCILFQEQRMHIKRYFEAPLFRTMLLCICRLADLGNQRTLGYKVWNIDGALHDQCVVKSSEIGIFFSSPVW